MPKTFSCIVPQCDTRSTSSIGFSLFKTTNSDAMKKRADACQMLVEDVKVTHRICHKHFSDTDFIIGENFKRLKLDAVPSKFLVSSFTTRILHYIFLICTMFENYSKYLLLKLRFLLSIFMANTKFFQLHVT